MTTPVNGQTGDSWYDHKIYVAKMLELTKSAEDLSSDFSNAFVADINGQNTTSVSVRLRPTLSLAPLDESTAEGLSNLAFTNYNGGNVTINIGAGEYYKVPVNVLGVKPAQATTEFAQAAGVAVLQYGNAELLRGITSQGTAVQADFEADDAQSLWDSMLAQRDAFADKYNLSEAVLHVGRGNLTLLERDIRNLSSSTDALTTAARLLGVGAVRRVSLPKVGTAQPAFSLSHRGAVAQAKVTVGPETQRVDMITSVLGAIKATTKVLDAEAVRVVFDAA